MNADTRRESQSRIHDLAEQVLSHKRAYYAGRPVISDADYDRLEDELRRLAPDHPALAMVGTDAATGGSAKVSHRHPMLSLQKTYSEDELFAWAKGYDLVGMWKIDGNSLSLVYRQGRLELAKTRGNGQLGEDVTDKARWVPSIPARLPESLTRGLSDEIELRGELCCSEPAFLRLADEMESLGLDRPTNPRNIVAGLLGRKEHLALARHFEFFAFDVLTGDDNAETFWPTEISKFQWFEKLGLPSPHPELLSGEAPLRAYLSTVRAHMEEGDIGLDGAVFSYNDTRLHRELGTTSHHPRAKMSFKWAGETARARVLRVEWATTRLGFVTPVAIVESVYLSGANITNITLHNAAHVKAYNIKAGDTIEIIRSGEVIPKFLAVVESREGRHEWPTVCPSCGSALTFDDVRLQCLSSDSCPAQRLRGILNWIEAAQIEDFAEKRLETMISQGLVRAIPDLYRVSVEELLTLPNTKETMAKKLHANIQKSRTLPLARFLQGLGIEGGGATTWEKLLRVWPTLEQLLFVSAEDVAAIDGFAEKSSRQLVEGLSARHALIEALLAAGVSPRASLAPASDGPLSGKSIAITGSLSRPRAEIEAAIKEAGGQSASSVSSHTFAVVTNDPASTSSKMAKARQLGIPIWSESDLWDKLTSKSQGGHS